MIALIGWWGWGTICSVVAIYIVVMLHVGYPKMNTKDRDIIGFVLIFSTLVGMALLLHSLGMFHPDLLRGIK